MEERHLVIFTAGVINSTARVKVKNDRIQLVEKAAVNNLRLKGLTWEVVTENIKPERQGWLILIMLIILQCNTRNLLANSQELKHFIKEMVVKRILYVVCVQETWLKLDRHLFYMNYCRGARINITTGTESYCRC